MENMENIRESKTLSTFSDHSPIDEDGEKQLIPQEQIINDKLSSNTTVMDRIDQHHQKQYDLPVNEPSRLKEGYFKRAKTLISGDADEEVPV